MWYVYRSVDAHKKHSEKAVYIILSSYLFESLLYLRKLIRSPDSQHKISRRSGSAAGKCWGRFSQSSEKNCLQLSQGRQPYSFYPAKIGACRISLQHPSTNSGHLKMNCGVVFYSLHWTNQKKSWCSSPKCLSVPIFGQGSLQTVEQSSFERAPTARGHPPCQAVVLEWCLLNDLQLSTA
jgi:hypothetical protein